MSLDDAIKTVRSLGVPTSETSVEAFETALSELSTTELADVQLSQLLLAFSDTSPRQDVLWTLLHFIESKGESGYVKAFVRQLETLTMHAPEWAETIACRILNTDRLDDQIVSALHERGPSTTRVFVTLVRPLTTAKGPIAERAQRILERLHARPDRG